MKRSIRAWAASIGVVLLAAGTVSLVSAPPAQAADSPNTLTFIPAKGLNVEVPKAVTGGPCPADSDSYVAHISSTDEPKFAEPIQITDPGNVNFSTTDPFEVQLGNSVLDVSKDAGLTAVTPGYYKITVTCQDAFSQNPISTFTGYLHFYTATDWQSGADVYPGSTTEVVPTATPTATTSTTATPSPTATTSPDPTASTDPTATDPTATDPTTDPAGTASPTGSATTTPTPTTSTSPASSDQLPVTGPPAGGLFALGIALILLGGCVVLGTMRFDRPQPARW